MSEQLKELIQTIIKEYNRSDESVKLLSKDFSNIVEHKRVTLYLNKEQIEIITKEFEDIVWE